MTDVHGQTTFHAALPGAVSVLSVRELIAELARVEESLHALPALIAHKGTLIPNPARRLLLRHEGAIVGELASRRRERGSHTAALR